MRCLARSCGACCTAPTATASGIPQMILDEKAEELRKKKEMQDAINVSGCAPCP